MDIEPRARRRVAKSMTFPPVLRLALRNVLRQRLRAGMTCCAIAFGVAGLIVAGGFVEDVLIQLAEGTIHSQSGHLQVFGRGFFEHGARTPEKYVMGDPSSVKGTIAGMPQVKEVLERVTFNGLLSHRRSDLPIVGEGIEPSKETALGGALTITAGRQLAASDHYGVLLGEGVAEVSGLKPGDQASILLSTTDGALNTLDFEVVGVFRSFSKDYDAHAVRMPLKAAQELLNTGGVTSIVVLLQRTRDTDTVVELVKARLGNGHDVKSWVELNDFYVKAAEMYRQQFGVLELIILIMVLLGVVNTVNMMVFERVGEFGTLMALGNRRRAIFGLIVVETALLGLGGAIIGALLGIAVAFVSSALGLEMPPLPGTSVGYTAQVRLAPGVVSAAALVGLVATVLAGLLPARRASRMPIATALRDNY